MSLVRIPAGTPIPKPSKGSALLDRREKRAAILAHEKAEKAKVVARDGAHVCRLISACTEREKHETAHVNDKGMGGDHGIRSTADQMLRACLFHHQGAWSLHSGDIRVDLLTAEGTNGPIEVWARDPQGQWYCVKRESACGIAERD